MKKILLVFIFLLTSSLYADDFLVTVNVAYQPYSLTSPWRKSVIGNRSGIGVMVKKGIFLIPADLIKDFTNITVSTPNSNKVNATVFNVDYGMNLCLLKVDDQKFLSTLNTIKLADSYKIGDSFTIEFFKDELLVKNNGTFQNFYLLKSWFSPYLYLTMVIKTLVKSTPGMPLIKNGMLAGICVASNDNKNQLYFTSLEVIYHFLKDSFSNKKYKGFVFNNIKYTDMKSKIFREYMLGKNTLRDKNNVELGVYIIRPGSNYKDSLKNGDILYKIDDMTIGNGGRVKALENPFFSFSESRQKYFFISDKKSGDIDFRAMMNNIYFPGDTISLSILRKNKSIKTKIALMKYDPEKFLVPETFYDRSRPSYIIYGGLILEELSGSFLKQWKDYDENSPVDLYLKYKNGVTKMSDKKYVFVANYLADEINLGYDDYCYYKTVKYINDIPIGSLKDVEKALNIKRKYTVIEFENTSFKAIFDQADIQKANTRIMNNYDINNMKYIF